MSAIATREPLLARVVRAIGAIFTPAPAEHYAGADFARDQAAKPGYDMEASMSAFAGHPWAYACAKAISEDLSGLPIQLADGTGRTGETIDAHPFLDLIDQPATRTNGVEFRRQVVVDLAMTGNSYWLILGVRPKSPDLPGVAGVPSSLIRLHPERVSIVPDRSGQPLSYVYDAIDERREYPWQIIVHVRDPSWEDGPAGLYGTGPIRPLHNDLSADIAATKRVHESAKRGRPDAIASPADGKESWAGPQVGKIKDMLNRVFAAAQGGVAVIGESIKLDILSWSPRDLEFGAQRALTREAILAAMGVPPTRVGLPTANYATAQQQDVVYWTTNQGRAALLDAALTRVARMFPRSERLRVYHDFSRVEALQWSRGERLQRVIDMVTWLGSDAAAAAAFEGLDDLPVGNFAAAALPGPAPAIEDAEEVPKMLALADYLTTREAPPSVQTEEVRSARWRTFLLGLHGPAEKRIGAAVSRHLHNQRRRTIARLEAVAARSFPDVVVREIEGVDLGEILADEAEREYLRRELGDRLLEVLRRAFVATARAMGVDLEYVSATRAGEDALAALVQHVSDTTRAALADTIRAAIAEGASAADIARAVQRAAAFSPSRAMAIARTEATKLSSTGSVDAMRQANADGIRVRKEWLTARDGAVRDSHRALDGVVVDAGQPFAIGGDTAQAPGGFAAAAESVNCRCTVLPVLEE